MELQHMLAMEDLRFLLGLIVREVLYPTKLGICVADEENQRIRKIDISTGIISTVVGNGVSGFSGDGGPAISAGLNYPIYTT
ncbi:MAG: hypothetical protein P4K83_10765 [Terracidiphilus sp.]|nr:hypothetical protein [Terracidiphilus sp.]